MNIIVTYDIVSNKRINEVSEYLKSCGFFRLQKSVFYGKIDNETYNNIKYELENMINLDVDSIYIFDICNKDINNLVYKSSNIEKRFINNEFLLI
ncbi:MAG: CRISPR-associated protein Cas2 [Fusobacteriaceae bacterium]|jgi:CRISPR-associated protein Cas2|nr:cas2 [Fusobacteriales bacterium]MDN5304814.1 CRISPR-associated protein Cas2 [Fusobacteriaceae bacterium]